MAPAVTLARPAVTAPIVGPRTTEPPESRLEATDVTLSKAMLDRIDEIVPPGVTLAATAEGHQAPATDPALRRRPEGLA